MSNELNKMLLSDIDEFCVNHFSDGYRSHLGASVIGQECARKIWYGFRWCFKEEFSGRMLRLFNRGHLEELRFVKWLKGIGCEVKTDDFSKSDLFFNWKTDQYSIGLKSQDNFEKGIPVSTIHLHVEYARSLGVKIPQFGFSAVDGHYGGSGDGIVIFPERYGIDEPVLLEGKTMKTGAEFDHICAQGIRLKKEIHYDQTSCYGKAMGLKKTVYLCANKNNDALHGEITDLDHNRGLQLEFKADKIIHSQEPPEKAFLRETHFQCKFCAASNICHKGGIPDKNCRSCINAKPIENAQWYCEHWETAIPKENILDACGEYAPITAQ